jgi:hypothetical protein
MRCMSNKMCKRSNTGILVVFFISAALLLMVAPANARAPERPDRLAASKGDPIAEYGVHFMGSVAMTITNLGVHGTGFIGATDCDGQGTPCPSCEFPFGSYVDYLFGGSYWIGAVVGDDTLVSVGADGWVGLWELYPGDQPGDSIEIRVDNVDDTLYYSPDAVSNLDYLAVFNDTLTDPLFTGYDTTDARYHIPMNIFMQQNSYSWSADGLDDFILFECFLENRGDQPLNQLWIGIFMDGDVMMWPVYGDGYDDDLAGYLAEEKIAYIMDNNGDPTSESEWNFASSRGVMGLKLHGSDPEYGRVNFNWWHSNENTAYDFGPRLKATPQDPFRIFGLDLGLGTPMGDRNKYYVLRHEEVDYDQLFTAVSHENEGFLAPPDNTAFAEDVAGGIDTRFLLSFGPFDLPPGDTVHFYYSVVMGADVHTDPTAYAAIFDPSDPQAYYDQFDFSDLLANGAAADSIYRDLAGIPTAADDNMIDPNRPDKYMLIGNYPNPFNPATTIEYNLPKRSQATLRVFNLLGQNIRTLVDAVQEPGMHTVLWNGKDDFGQQVSSGVYFYQLKTTERVETKKMILLK